MTAPVRKRLGELLVEAGIIDETQLKAALGHQRQWGVRLGQAIVDMKLATEQEVVRVLAKRFGFEVARLDQLEAYAHQQAIELVPRDFAVKHNVFPLSADSSSLSVAMSDPSNLAVIDELRFRSGRRVKVSIGGDREVAAAIHAAYPSLDGAVEAIDLDVDDGGPGEAVMTTFGGGSSEDFESFFGTEPAQPTPAGAGDPFGAGPAEAPTPASPHAPTLEPPAPFTIPAAPAPAPATPAAAPIAPPASFTVPGTAAATAPAAPVLAQAARPTATRPAPHPAAAAHAPAPAPAPPRAAAPTAAANRPAPAPVQPAPVQPASARAAPPAAPARPRPAAPGAASADAVRDARALRGAPAAPGPAVPTRPAAAPAPAPAPASDPLLLDVEEELTPFGDVGEAEAPTPARYTAAEQAILTALERLADGGRAEPETLKPTQLMAALARLLLRKGLLTERELLDALQKPGAG